MEIKISNTEYNLKLTLFGQIFRFKEINSNHFLVISRDKYCYISQDTNHIELVPSSDEDIDYWMYFFNFDEDLNELMQLVSGNEFLQDVMDYSEGLHLLQQDPWETLISFIISQQKKIPQIQSSINQLCFYAGHDLIDDYCTFPTPEELLSYNIKKANLGYREKYVLNAATYVKEGYINLDRLRFSNGATYKQAMQELSKLD